MLFNAEQQDALGASIGAPKMFEQAFRNIDDTLRKDAECSSELDYVEQTSWVLFLKYLDDLEKEQHSAAELTDKPYTPIMEK